jgi:hypothetical protein
MAGTALVHREAFSSGVKVVRGENNGRCAAAPLSSVPRLRKNGP